MNKTFLQFLHPLNPVIVTANYYNKSQVHYDPISRTNIPNLNARPVRVRKIIEARQNVISEFINDCKTEAREDGFVLIVNRV